MGLSHIIMRRRNGRYLAQEGLNVEHLKQEL